MKNIIFGFNYISIPFQRIQKLQYKFCLSNQDVRQNINKLIELNEQQLNSINQIEKETLSLQIATIENELEQYLQSFQKHQKQPYYLFRKNLVQLAFYTYYNSKFDLCQQYISYATVGDYENTYQGELMKQLFLAELSGIQFRINYQNQELELAEKSLAHWKNIIENHSNFYKEMNNNQKFDIIEFFENMENVHFHQYIETLVVVGQLQYVKGLFTQSISKFEQVKVLIQSILKFINQEDEQEKKLSLDNKSYKDFYINQLKRLLSKSYIHQIRLAILMNDLVKAKQLYDQGIALQNLKFQAIQLEILNFDIQFYLGNSDDVLELIQSKVEQEMSNMEDKLDTKDIFIDYYSFRIKYNLDMNNSEIQLKYLSKINQNIEKIIEINHHSIQQLILQENYLDALIIANQQYQLLNKHKLTKHYIFQLSLQYLFFIMVKLNKVEELKALINQTTFDSLYNPEIYQLYHFYQLTLQVLLLRDNDKGMNILSEMNTIKFQNTIQEYFKLQILEIFYNQMNMKEQLIENLREQMKYLNQNQKFNKDQIEYVKQKIENLSF
ncbi:unnamed protein product [Paramecium pentaurelia]|uniref:Uncharacterized protein n=1 Tax=Paramecium pentaurelia TaxID=43138 RepID=A0A8S1SLC0_9CILI|nr:unnamed protein product [Paramecium pentaurelia]